MENRLLKVQEVAEILGISKSYAFQLVSRGLIPSIRLGKKAVRVRPIDVENFISNNIQNEIETKNSIGTVDKSSKD